MRQQLSNALMFLATVYSAMNTALDYRKSQVLRCGQNDKGGQRKTGAFAGYYLTEWLLIPYKTSHEGCISLQKKEAKF